MEKLLYILFSISIENNIFNCFFTEIFVKNFKIILETKILVKKRLNILFSVLMENIILLIDIYSFFHIGIFHSVLPYVDIYIYIV